jgi:hypothetical protein
MAMLELMRGMIGNGFTVHGTARALFNTWAKETTNFDNVTRNAALAHTEEKLEDAYARDDGGRMFAKRKQLINGPHPVFDFTPMRTGHFAWPGCRQNA